jgi:hypothetical protein
MDPARIELPGLAAYQVPEHGSANDGSAVLCLPSCFPLPRLGRDLGALCLEYCLEGLIPLPQLQSVGIILPPSLFTCPLLRCVTYTFIIWCGSLFLSQVEFP